MMHRSGRTAAAAAVLAVAAALAQGSAGAAPRAEQGSAGTATPAELGSAGAATPAELGSAGAATPATWRPVAVPQPHTYDSHSLGAVSCPTATFCMAVGSSQEGTDGPTPAVEIFDGRNWSLRHPADLGAGTAFTSVSCVSPTDCAIAGRVAGTKATGADEGVIERWDGTNFTVQQLLTPAKDDVDIVSAVSCPSTTVCFAAGSKGAAPDTVPLLERWEPSTGWKATPAGDPGIEQGLTAISCTSATFCVAVGGFGNTAGAEPSGNLAQVWHGATWTKSAVPAGSRQELSSVSCPAAGSCMAVGGGVDTAAVSYVLHGPTWTAHAIGAGSTTEPVEEDAVDCRTATSCQAVGDQDLRGRVDGVPVVDHWDGSTWSARSITRPAEPVSGLSALSCPTGSVCWGVGAGSSAVTSSTPEARVLVERGTPA